MKSILTFIFTLACFFSYSQYQIIWSDEFNGSNLDSNKWNYDIGQGVWGWGNNELQYYTNDSSNIRVDTGYLHITAKQENMGTANYTSARIKTQNKFDFQYGKTEARIKLPMGQGLWPAFWMLGSNITTVGWPQCGEIDIMEHVNNSSMIHGTHHFDNNGHVYNGNSISTTPSDFHIYAVEWNADSIKWFLDGQLFFQTDITSPAKTEFHNPYFLILNLAVGGVWPGSPNASTAFPSTMLIDYVRVYQDTSFNNDLEITVDVCSANPSSVRMVGPLWNNWDPVSGPNGVDNGDGSWTFTLSPAPTTSLEYLISVDGNYESLIGDMQDGGSCAPVTDFWSYANRLWNPGDGLDISINYDRCVPCSYPDVSITVEFCDTTGLGIAKLVGPIYGWNYSFAKEGTNNGDGTWTFNFTPAPVDTLEYLIFRDGIAENLIADMQNGGNCAPATDFSTYANRRWTLQDVDSVSSTFDSCNTCNGNSISLGILNISAQDAICNGENTGSVSVNAYGGTPPYVYQWNTVGSDSTQSVSGLATGVYTVSISDISGFIVIDSIIVNEPAAFTISIITDDTSSCGNCNGSASAFPVNGNSPFQFLWNDSNAQNNQTALGLCPGNYSVSIQDTDGCQATESISILNGGIVSSSINSSSGNYTICDSLALVLTASGNYAGYLWSNGETSTGISVFNSNTYSVTVTDSLGCSLIQSVIVDAFNSPSGTNFQYTATGLNLNFITNPGYSYLWNFGDGDTSILQNPQHLYDSAGTYTVILYTSNPCGNDSSSLQVTVSLVTCQNLIFPKENITIFPNPFKNYSTVSFYNPEHQKHQFNLMNSQGKIIRQYINITEESFRIKKNNLSTGIYFYTLSGPLLRISGKLLVE